MHPSSFRNGHAMFLNPCPYDNGEAQHIQNWHGQHGERPTPGSHGLHLPNLCLSVNTDRAQLDVELHPSSPSEHHRQPIRTSTRSPGIRRPSGLPKQWMYPTRDASMHRLPRSRHRNWWRDTVSPPALIVDQGIPEGRFLRPFPETIIWAAIQTRPNWKRPCQRGGPVKMGGALSK